jgi:hypothetical protein
VRCDSAADERRRSDRCADCNLRRAELDEQPANEAGYRAERD